MTDKSTFQNITLQEDFDIRPAAVKLWIENLPLGSTGETSKQIYHALKKVNQQENALQLHLEFLEAISPTLSLLYPRLSRYFVDISLPLSKKTRNVIHVTTRLLNEVLNGYQIVTKTLATKKPFSVALHRTFIFTSQILCAQRLVYQPYSKGAWREIFWCYQQAESLKLLNKKYINHNLEQEKTSVDYEFKRLLLLSLLSANDLGQKNMKEVHKLMPLWVKYAEILPKETDEKTTCFTLNLLSDISPYLIGTHKDSTLENLDRHFLSTHKLKKILTGYLTKTISGGAVRVGKNILSKSTIEALLSSWSRNRLRKELRKEGSGFVDIITGISAVHFVLTQQDQPAYDEVSVDIPDNVIDFETTLKIEPLSNPSKDDTLSLDHFLSSTDQKEEDVWGRVFENSLSDTSPDAHWTETGTHKTYSFSKSILLDYSKDGYKLSVNDKNIDSLKHNELVAVREHALAPWALAQVKWLHFSKIGDVQFGIQILSHHVLPVHIRYSTNSGLSKPLPCLLGLDRQKLMLFIPTLPTKLDGKKLELEHQEKRSQIQLKQKLLTTSAFDIYEIHEPQPLESTSSQEELKNPEIIIDNSADNPLSDNIWQNF